MNKCTCQAEIHSSENMCSNCLHELHQEIKEYEESIYWIHQFANYMNTLVNEYRKYGEVTGLTSIGVEEFKQCFPHITFTVDKERDGLYTVYVW